MFQLNLNFWQMLIKWTVLLVLFWGSVFAGISAFNLLKTPKVEEVSVENPVYVPQVTNLDKLQQGQSVRWFNYDLCVSSIDQSNIPKSEAGDEPPVSIHLRKQGQC